MIRFGVAQSAVFGQDARERFMAEMVAHCREYSPHLCKTLDAAGLAAAVRRAVERAEADGWSLRGPVRLYVDLSLLFGSGFADDPQYPGARALAHAGDELARSEALHAWACEYLRRVGGPDNAYTRASLARLAAADESTLTVGADRFGADVLQLLKTMHPEKYAYTGDAPLLALIAAADERARSVHGFRSARAVLVLAVLMFAFGHECDRDPLYPWIERTLVDADGDRDALAVKLERRARIWLRAVLKHTRGDEQ